MSDLINRQDAIELCRKYSDSELTSTEESIGAEYCIDLLQEMPSAEPERKTGHWIDTDNYYYRWQCSECGMHTREPKPNFCPWCGADTRDNDG